MNNHQNTLEMNPYEKTAAKYVPGLDFNAGKDYMEEHNSQTTKILFIGLFVLLVGIGLLITGFVEHEEGNNSTVLFTTASLLILISVFIIYYSYTKNKK